MGASEYRRLTVQKESMQNESMQSETQTDARRVWVKDRRLIVGRM